MEVQVPPSRPSTTMDIAAETENLLQSLRQDNKKQQDEIRARKEALLLKLRAKTVPTSTKALAIPAPNVNSLLPSAASVQIPVARATSHPLLNGKKRMLGEMKKAARIQGADSMAKLFGYKNYVEQKQHLEKEEKLRIQLLEMKKKAEEVAKATVLHQIPDADDEESDEDFVPENESSADNENDLNIKVTNTDSDDDERDVVVLDEDESRDQPVPSLTGNPVVIPSNSDATANNSVNVMAAAGLLSDEDEPHHHTSDDESQSGDDGAVEGTTTSPSSLVPATRPVPRRRRLQRPVTIGNSDEDENDADMSDDEQENDDNDAAADAATEQARKDSRNADKAANYRAILAADEAAESGRRRDKQSGGLLNLVESEAEEEEEEDVLKIGGLGDFGFGVAAPKPVEKERETEADLALREDDLDNIVDELSDDEKNKDADDYFRERMEAEDKQQVSEVMRNVREGFGRNRRVFSSSLNGEARGRFNLDELVAADGSKKEAARLGLLESDEERDDEDDGDKKAEEDEEDEEERMERELRERYQRQPKIYITSSESESESENDQDQEDKEEIPSDEEREARQMKLFSAKAKINRRMQVEGYYQENHWLMWHCSA
ncbi:hypothetical protein DYB32_002806 [Aphanomyces invadans]|uniref:DNA replication checkpoint mediator MRC1 domain-containing protein n=1 Tax=Aphanomyces invadans TaxID=157072 RepID=A0A418B277_9STRA|nr:hypothetical protein DYB32_002806 [Aphanomyces invadans]